MALLFTAHSLWRWVVLAVVLGTLVRMIAGASSRAPFGDRELKMLLASRIALYIQVVLGLVMLVGRPELHSMRFLGEHVFLALLGVGGVEFGAARAKRLTEPADRYRFASIGFGIGSVLLVLTVLLRS